MRTITRIVDVVPFAIRIVIGALMALALAAAVRSRLTALRARKLERQRFQLLQDVGLLQAALLPEAPARLGLVSTSAAYRPADGPGAGGDFYDIFALKDGSLAAIVGDVSGHGRQALPHTALVRFTLRAYLEAGLPPREALQTAGLVLERQLGESFVTVVVARYHPRERTLTYACAGHPQPLVIGSGQIKPITLCSAPPVGVGMRTGTRQTVVSVPGQAQVCLYTDGVTEARVGPTLFGARRLARALTRLGHSANASALLDSVAQETDQRPDDMAACLLSIEGGVAAPYVLAEQLELDRERAESDRPERLLAACGLSPEEVQVALHAARREMDRVGSILLEVTFAEGVPRVVVRSDNVTSIDLARVAHKPAVGASQ